MFDKRASQCIVVDGEVISAEYGKDYSEDSYVEWGSITKTVTARAVAALVAQGTLNYDDSANRFMPGGLPDSVTIGTLTAHTSGLPAVHAGMSTGIIGDPYTNTGADFLDKYLAAFTPDLLEQPGVECYSNLGYAVLGRVVAEVTGTPWFDAVQRLALAPMELDGVVLEPPVERVAAIAGFNRRPRKPWAVTDSAYAPAGALWSTLPTLARYGWLTIVDGGYATPYPGWQRGTQEVGETFWHNGQTRDAGSCLVCVPDERLVVVTHTLGQLPGKADKLAWAAVDANVSG